MRPVTKVRNTNISDFNSLFPENQDNTIRFNLFVYTSSASYRFCQPPPPHPKKIKNKKWERSVTS